MSPAERAASRVLQVLETQRVIPERFEAQQCHGAMHIRIVLTANDQQAVRIGWLLRRAFAVQSAHWLALTGCADELHFWQQTALAAWSDTESGVDLDPASSWWQTAPSTLLLTDNRGMRLPGHATDVRMRWTTANLYLLFDCAYEDRYVRPEDPTLEQPTPRLWEHDVAELFLAPDAHPLQRYMEFEVSPRGEWIDLNITAHDGVVLSTAALHSGFIAAAAERCDERRWSAFLRVPMASFAELGTHALRLNLFRSQGQRPLELAWQPTYQASFHVPSRFGYLHLLPA